MKKKVTDVQKIRLDKWNVKVINNQKSYIKFWTIWLKQLYESNIIKWNITEEHIEAGLQNEAVLTYLTSFSKLNIQKTEVMASGSITLWQIDRETMKTMGGFIFLGSKITADGDCSHELKRCLLLGRKAMTNLDSILKSRDITLPTKVCLVKAVVF